MNSTLYREAASNRTNGITSAVTLETYKSAPRFQSRHVSDISEVEKALNGDSQCIQLSPGPLSGFTGSTHLGAISIYEHAVDRGIQIRRHVNDNTLVLGFLIQGERVFEHGRLWATNQTYVSRASDIDLSTLYPCHILWIEISLRAVPMMQREDLLHASLSGFFADSSAFTDLRSRITHIVEELNVANGAVARRDRLHFQSEVILEVILALRRAKSAASTEVKREYRSFALVQRVEQYMWNNVEEPLTLDRICKQVHCGMRGLIYSFKDMFGLGPMTYWKICRLNAAHRKLKAARAQTSIFEVAADFGFWHMGHFSSDYKRMFGITPSQTIASTNGGRSLLN